MVGSPVNLTARIESYTVGGQVLISEATRQEIGPHVKVAEKIEVAAKGVDKPIAIYNARGIGGKYNLYLPESTDTLVSLPQAIPLQFTLLEGKHMGDTVFTGSLVKLSAKDGEVRSERAPVESWSDIKSPAHAQQRWGRTSPPPPPVISMPRSSGHSQRAPAVLRSTPLPPFTPPSIPPKVPSGVFRGPPWPRLLSNMGHRSCGLVPRKTSRIAPSTRAVPWGGLLGGGGWGRASSLQ